MPEEDDLGRIVIRYGCAVCRRVLEPHPLGWMHTPADGETDHPAVPVPVEELKGDLRQRCDFCLAEDPTHTLPVRPFRHPLFADGENVDDFAACGACAVLLAQQDWVGLLQRCVDEHAAREGVPMPWFARKVLTKALEVVRANAYGPVREGAEG